jgi:hypothetical protein
MTSRWKEETTMAIEISDIAVQKKGLKLLERSSVMRRRGYLDATAWWVLL